MSLICAACFRCRIQRKKARCDWWWNYFQQITRTDKAPFPRRIDRPVANAGSADCCPDDQLWNLISQALSDDSLFGYSSSWPPDKILQFSAKGNKSMFRVFFRIFESEPRPRHNPGSASVVHWDGSEKAFQQYINRSGLEKRILLT